jgi:hypothetical protein
MMDAVDDANPKDRLGARKVPLGLCSPTATVQWARVMANGADKYGEFNWRAKKVKLTVYADAISRHNLAVQCGEDVDPESGLPHLAHVMACASIILDAASCGALIDDRFLHGEGGLTEMRNGTDVSYDAERAALTRTPCPRRCDVEGNPPGRPERGDGLGAVATEIPVVDMSLEDIRAEIADPSPLPEDPVIAELAAAWKTTTAVARSRLSMTCYRTLGRYPKHSDQALQWLGAHWRADRADTLRQIRELRSGTEDSRPGTSESKVESPRPPTINRCLEDGLHVAQYVHGNSFVIPVPRATFPVPLDSDAIAIIERRAYADEDVAHLPRLPRELNATEHGETLHEYQWLYDWSEDAGGKWVLRNEYVERWGREA